jgi:thymidylate synthase
LKQYLDALKHIIDTGEESDDRTGVGTTSVFGYQMHFDLQAGFPAVTTKKLAWRSVVGELIWFLEGSTDERRLAEITHGTRDTSKNTIWTANANKQGKDLGYSDGELGPVYGKQWRDFNGVDQVAWVLNEIKNNPDSRRIIMSAWNPPELPAMALPPCHTMAQFKVTNGKLNCQLYQRSADMFLGVPFNIASYSLLTHMFAQICELKVGKFVWTGGDCHIYRNHFRQVLEQVQRKPQDLPHLLMPAFNDIGELLSTSTSDYKLINYNPMPSIKAPMAV